MRPECAFTIVLRPWVAPCAVPALLLMPEPTPSKPSPSPRSAPSSPAPAERDDLYTPEQAAFDRVLVERIRTGRASGASAEESLDSRRAMGVLIERYQSRVFAICFRMVAGTPSAGDTAGDLSHDTFVRIIQGLEGFDSRSKLSTWVFRVTMNTCLSYLRSSKVRRTVSLDTIGLDAIGDASLASHAFSEREPDAPEPAPGDADEFGIAGSLIRKPANTGTPASVRASIGHAQGQSRELSPDQGVEHREERRRVALALAGLDPEQRAVLVLRDVQGFEYEHIASILEIAVGTVKSRLFRARLALRDALHA